MEYKKLAILFLALLLMAQVNAQEEVKVGVYLLNLGKFDVSTGAFTADFYLSMICKNPCDTPKFEFVNGRASSIDKIIDEDNQKFYRIQAQLANNVDLKDFPFDKHTLTIELEDKEKTINELVYVINDEETGIDPDVKFVGWKLDSWNAKVVEHEYKVYGETYSKYIYSINISRVILNSILKTFIPVIFILFIALLSHLIAPDKVTNRLGINTGSLIASVMFHVNISNQIPPVGYLTFADKFMFITYFILLLSLISSILILQYYELKHHEKADIIHKKSMKLVPLTALASYLILFLSSLL